jgi:hypothetical protein
MAGTQRLLAIAMAFLLPGSPGSAKPDALGFVVQADHPILGSQNWRGGGSGCCPPFEKYGWKRKCE